jgi:uncharacterized protein with PIN domain
MDWRPDDFRHFGNRGGRYQRAGRRPLPRGDAWGSIAVDLVGYGAGDQDSLAVSPRRQGAEAVRAFDEMLENAGIITAPFDVEMAEVAFSAFRRYGKGQGHPAQLNIIDCAAYALAKVRGESLLFKGGDFEKTDIELALGDGNTNS